MKHSLAIFDLDGTILYTLVDLKNSMNFTLKEFSLSAPLQRAPTKKQ